MMIDENRVIAKSKTYTKGFKGMAPTFKRGRDGRLFAAISTAIVAAFLFGLGALVYTLITEGGTAVENIRNSDNGIPQYFEVTYKPKQTK